MWLVELGDLRDAVLLIEVVAARLRVRERAPRSIKDSLVEHLAPRQVLLVLDNCEHLLDAVAGLAADLLHACPHLRILTTSREPLDIGGEVVFRVPPLTVPDRTSSLRGIPRYDAVTLFRERAVAAVSDFAVTDDNQAVVSSICRKLDGMPLPIELAAARIRVMSPEQILQRLTDRFALLTTGPRGAPSRQQTLRLSVDWSHELCSDHERLAWSRLSVFAGGFELDAAQHICSLDGGIGDTVDAVTALVDKSILLREQSGTVVRFRMLETIREYGRAKARQSGEYLALRSRHSNWYDQVCRAVESEWIGPGQLDAIARLDREQPNIRRHSSIA